MPTARALPLLAVLALGLGAGCEKTDHESIDRWLRTQKGPAKLARAAADEGIDADLSAHAAANLVKLGQDAELRAVLERLAPTRRVAVVAALAPRLWEQARVDGELTMPSADKVLAKDALFALRAHADERGRAAIDGYLTDWYTGGYYEGRAQLGMHTGGEVLRALGPEAGKKLLAVANALVARPGPGGAKLRIGDELMLGMAVSGSPDAVRYVLDLAHMERGDPSLRARALSALYKAYVEPGATYRAADPAALAPSLDALVAVARDDSNAPQVTNDAVSLIRVTGMPGCLAPLVSLIASPHRDPRFRYVGANNALKCGGVKAILEVARALPERGAYAREELAGAVWGEIARLSPRPEVVAAARALVADQSPIARWIGIEVLAAVGSVEDAGRIKAVAGGGRRLTGYWGRGAEAGRPEPTLGQRAAELAAGLGPR